LRYYVIAGVDHKIKQAALPDKGKRRYRIMESGITTGAFPFGAGSQTFGLHLCNGGQMMEKL
jgi:hypothetical protein